jgi:hypothetical protein
MRNLILRCRAVSRCVLSHRRTAASSPVLNLLVLCAIELSLANLAFAQSYGPPIFNPGNGHYYQLALNYPGRYIPFDVALADAESRTYLGIPGHLVTITSQAEQDFLANNPTLRREVMWIAASDAAIEGEWRWVAGPEKGQLFWRGDYVSGTAIGYQSWMRHNGYQLEPNNVSRVPGDDVGEDFASVHDYVYGETGTILGRWNDVAAFDTTTPGSSFNPTRYIIEYSPIPEPSALPIVSASLLAFSLRRRRNRPFPAPG